MTSLSESAHAAQDDRVIATPLAVGYINNIINVAYTVPGREERFITRTTNATYNDVFLNQRPHAPILARVASPILISPHRVF